MIPQETVNLILDTAKIEDVVGDYVTLKRRGASFVACCPFHNEKTPSFYVTPSKGIYKCFGCGKAGSAVGFVMEQEHCSYPDALRYLAKKYHIEIIEEELDAEQIASRQRKESLLLVSEFAQKFFASRLKEGEGRAVGYAYFRSRAIEDETIERFGLGWAPSGKTELVDAAIAAGYKMEYLLDAGLAVKYEDGSVVDKFRERAMFPIHSVSGRVVAFSGRTLRSDNPAKYVNSPETEIFVKSRNLLGIYLAKSEISRLQKCILVEGNVDVVMMHQLGIRNVVASCGTSLTVEQVRLIHKFTDNLTIMYDGDSAGIKAALRGLNLVLAEGMNVKVVLLPDGDDPDSFSRKHTLEEVQDYIAANEKDFISLKADLLLEDAAGDPIKKANLINDIADTIAEIPDPVKRSVYVEAVSSRFGIESEIIFERIRTDRLKMQEEAARQRERERRQREAERRGEAQAADGLQPDDYMEPVSDYPEGDYLPEQLPQDGAWVPENKLLEQPEKELLGFLLGYGCDMMEFESDSEYFTEDENEKCTVADFIRSSLEADGTVMANSLYARMYDRFFELYDEGMDQDGIVRTLLNGADRTLADLAVDLTTEKYQLTVNKFSASLTATKSWLVKFVPKAIMVYQERRLQDSIDGIRRALKAGGDDAVLLAQLQKYTVAQRKVKALIGREKR